MFAASVFNKAASRQAARGAWMMTARVQQRGMLTRASGFRGVVPTVGALASKQASVLASQRRYISDELRSKFDKIIKDNKIVVFMKGNKDAPQCGFSNAVVQVLTIQGLEDFKTVNVLADEEVRNGIKEYSEWPTIPQVYVDGEFVGGCDILIKMHQSGDLKKLLVDAKLVEDEPVAEQPKA